MAGAREPTQIGRTARLVDEDGVLVATADPVIDEDKFFALIHPGRL